MICLLKRVIFHSYLNHHRVCTHVDSQPAHFHCLNLSEPQCSCVKSCELLFSSAEIRISWSNSQIFPPGCFSKNPSRPKRCPSPRHRLHDPRSPRSDVQSWIFARLPELELMVVALTKKVAISTMWGPPVMFVGL